MKSAISIIILLTSICSVFAQHGSQGVPSTSKEEAEAVQQWMRNIYETGVVVTNDTFTVTEEARLVAVDSALRAVVFPADYDWAKAQYLLKNMHIKIGLWHLINLYHEREADRPAVLQLVTGLSEVFDMKKALTAAFYTYIFFDPEASSIVNGKPVIHRPDILDEKFSAVRSMLERISS